MMGKRYSFWSTLVHFNGYLFVLAGVGGLAQFLFLDKVPITLTVALSLVSFWRVILGLVLLGCGWLFRRAGLYPQYILSWVVISFFAFPVILELLAVLVLVGTLLINK